MDQSPKWKNEIYKTLRKNVTVSSCLKISNGFLEMTSKTKITLKK